MLTLVSRPSCVRQCVHPAHPNPNPYPQPHPHRHHRRRRCRRHGGVGRRWWWRGGRRRGRPFFAGLGQNVHHTEGREPVAGRVVRNHRTIVLLPAARPFGTRTPRPPVRSVLAPFVRGLRGAGRGRGAGGLGGGGQGSGRGVETGLRRRRRRRRMRAGAGRSRAMRGERSAEQGARRHGHTGGPTLDVVCLHFRRRRGRLRSRRAAFAVGRRERGVFASLQGQTRRWSCEGGHT